MLQLLNGNSADIYYFGGNSVRQEPFSVDKDGNLMYNCKDGDSFRKVALKDLSSTDNPNDPTDDSKYALYKQIMNSGLFVDIGMGIRSEGATTTLTPPASTIASTVDRNSVFTYTLPGIEITGVGTAVSSVTGKQVSMNIYDLLGEIANSFADNDYTYEKTDELFGFLFGGDKAQLPTAILASEKFLSDGVTPNPEYGLNPTHPNHDHYDPELDKTNTSGTPPFNQTKYDDLMSLYENITPEHRPGAAQSVQFAITTIGTKMQFLNFVSDSLDTRELNDLEQQQNAEFVDPIKATIYYESQKVAYQAALNMGAQIIPMSIFNYMR
jgi:flagellin-like hook-associated protein FlgL